MSVSSFLSLEQRKRPAFADRLVGWRVRQAYVPELRSVPHILSLLLRLLRLGIMRGLRAH